MQDFNTGLASCILDDLWDVAIVLHECNHLIALRDHALVSEGIELKRSIHGNLVTLFSFSVENDGIADQQAAIVAAEDQHFDFVEGGHDRVTSLGQLADRCRDQAPGRGLVARFVPEHA